MSSVMYGRYVGVESLAADKGAVPKVMAVEPGADEPMRREDNEPESFNFAGLLGDKVLALLPAEALAFHTFVTDNADTELRSYFSFDLGQWCVVVILSASLFFMLGRVSGGSYSRLRKMLWSGEPSPLARTGYAAAELLRALVPALAITSWLFLGESEMIQAIDLPGWLDWLSIDAIELRGWGLILLIIATICASVANRVGFKPGEHVTEPAAGA